MQIKVDDKILKTMAECGIPGVSIVYRGSDGNPVPVVSGVTDAHSATPGADVGIDTVFGAASLSKPVFSYLVLKLIRDKTLVTTKGAACNLDTPISELLPDGSYSIANLYEELNIKSLSAEFVEKAKTLTPRMILSHTTGIPISGEPKFSFDEPGEPGTRYAYSGLPLMYLQRIIERSIGKSIATLAQEEIFAPLLMDHSSFYPVYKLGLIDELAPESQLTPGTIYLKNTEDGLQYKVIGLDLKPREGSIPWDDLPANFGKDHLDLNQIKAHFLPSILEYTAKVDHCRVANNAANSLVTTASDYDRFISAWMAEKDCALIKMSVDPTLESQMDAPYSRYILTDTGLFYFNKFNNKPAGTLEKIELDTANGALEQLHQKFSAVAQDSPIDLLSTAQLRDIIQISKHSNPLQEAFIPQISLTLDDWAMKAVSDKSHMEYLAWGLGLGLQLDDNKEVMAAFHTGDMYQYRAWAVMDLKTKAAVVYFANSNIIMNGSGHSYGHVLADLIVAPVIHLEHAAPWFFEKFHFPRDVFSVLQQWDADEAQQVRSPILDTFWEHRVIARNEQSIDVIKGFIKSHPPKQWNDIVVDRERWSGIVDEELVAILQVPEENKLRFLKLFEHISDKDILAIDKGEGFQLAKQNEPRVIAHEFKRKLDEIRHTEAGPSEVQASAPTPFSTTLKPKE